MPTVAAPSAGFPSGMASMLNWFTPSTPLLPTAAVGGAFQKDMGALVPPVYRHWRGWGLKRLHQQGPINRCPWYSFLRWEGWLRKLQTHSLAP